MNKETLEESARKWYSNTKLFDKGELNAFIAGAKWQSDKTYSEEEVLELLKKALTHKDDGEIGNLVTAKNEIRSANFYSWFEQYKKKKK